MNEDQNDLSLNGDEGYQDDESDFRSDIDDATEYDEETTEDGETANGRAQEQDEEDEGEEAEERVSPAVIAQLGPVATEDEIDGLAADLGFTKSQMVKAAQFFGRIAQHNVAAAGISNGHLQNEVGVSPGLRSMVASIQRELAGVPAQRQTEKNVVQWAIATAFVKEAKPADTFADIVKRMAKSCGLTVGGNASQPRQEAHTELRRPLPATPTPSVSGGARKPAQQQEQPRRSQGSGAAAFLANRYGLSGADLDQAKDEITGRRRPI